jgi:hypothetical protein
MVVKRLSKMCYLHGDPRSRQWNSTDIGKCPKFGNRGHEMSEVAQDGLGVLSGEMAHRQILHNLDNLETNGVKLAANVEKSFHPALI